MTCDGSRQRTAAMPYEVRSRTAQAIRASRTASDTGASGSLTAARTLGHHGAISHVHVHVRCSMRLRDYARRWLWWSTLCGARSRARRHPRSRSSVPAVCSSVPLLRGGVSWLHHVPHACAPRLPPCVPRRHHAVARSRCVPLPPSALHVMHTCGPRLPLAHRGRTLFLGYPAFGCRSTRSRAERMRAALWHTASEQRCCLAALRSHARDVLLLHALWPSVRPTCIRTALHS